MQFMINYTSWFSFCSSAVQLHGSYSLSVFRFLSCSSAVSCIEIHFTDFRQYPRFSKVRSLWCSFRVLQTVICSYSEMEVINRKVGLWHCITHYPKCLANTKFSCNHRLLQHWGQITKTKKPPPFHDTFDVFFLGIEVKLSGLFPNFFFGDTFSTFPVLRPSLSSMNIQRELFQDYFGLFPSILSWNFSHPDNYIFNSLWILSIFCQILVRILVLCLKFH